MEIRQSIGWVAAIAIFLVTASSVFAQLPVGTILGEVKDPSGGVVAGVNLIARNIETGQSRKVTSGTDGAYRFTALPVGNYEIKAEHAGFDAVVINGVTLTVGEEQVVNVALQVGSVSQSVSVNAVTSAVNTTSGALAALVDERQISDLPLNGRNYLDLMLLQPGIAADPDKKSTGAQIGEWFSSNGAPVRSNNVLLDGAHLNNMLGTSPTSASGSSLGIDGIKEWRVVTNAFSAEYGTSMGSQMLMVSKGGTNQFHGGMFEYLRNDVLDAANYFYVPIAATNFARIPPYKRNQFGGSFGGPIIKDKTFFYGVYEGLRERLGVTTVNTTIPAADHVTTNNPGCGGCSVPAVIQPILALFQNPNLPANQFTFPYSQPTNEDFGQMRVDQNISSADTAFVRYTIDNTVQVQTATNPEFSDLDYSSRNQYLTLGENHIISSNLLNSARFSYSRTLLSQINPPVPGLNGPQYSFIEGQQMGTLSVGGLTAIGGDGGPTPVQQFKQNLFTWSDDVFYTRGKHALKFGVLFNHYQLYFIRAANQHGTINFSNVSHFLQGIPSTYSTQDATGSITDRTFHNSTAGFYAQDDWRIRSNVTLNLGLRYEFATTFDETHGHSASVRNILTDTATTIGPPYKDPSHLNFGPRVGVAWDVMGDGKTSVRSGFALLYDVGNMGTALYIGSIIPPFAFSDSVSNSKNTLLTLPLNFPASAVGNSIAGINWNLQQPYMMQYNLAIERQLPWNMVVSVAYGGSRGNHLLQVTEGNPTIPTSITDGLPFWAAAGNPRINTHFGTYTMITSAAESNYNSLQAQLTKRLTKGLEMQVVFTRAKALDDISSQGTNDSASTPDYPEYPQNIHLDYGPSPFDTTNNLRLNALYQFPDFHGKKGLMGSALSGWNVNGILTEQSGFPFTPVIQSNRSFSGVNGGGAAAGSGSATADRPNILPGRSLHSITHGTSTGCTTSTGSVIAAGTPLGTPTLFLDPCAFSLQPTGTLGNAGRDSLYGPGINNLDFSIVKDTPLKFREGAMVEFRAEFFNLFNHPSFVPPAVGAGNSASIIFAGTPADVTENPLPTVGRLNTTSDVNREIQLAIKLVF